jgi:hypothetical protein
MPSITGIEIGPDYCVLLRARHRASRVEVSSVRIVEAPEWPAEPALRSRLLQRLRQELDLPRRATVVAWQREAFTASTGEAMLRQAGFVPNRILTPCEALALVAWSRRQIVDPRPSAWLSINRHGAAIAVVRELDVLYSTEFDWRIRAAEQRVQAGVLRRYLYVAQLVPEVRRAAAAVRESHREDLAFAVACGNIAELRSFTMPLIDQLDLEFETLDSLDGLHLSDEDAAAVGQEAAALRLAAAAAGHARSPSATLDVARALGIAAGVVLLAGAAWWTFQMLPERGRERTPQNTRVVATQGRERPSAPVNTRVTPSQPDAGSAPSATTGVGPSTGSGQARSTGSGQGAPTSSGQAPLAGSGQAPSTGSGQAHSTRSGQVATAGTAARESGGIEQASLPPLPAVTGILISRERRLAVIQGVVVGVGDRVAGRTVARIELDGVVLREPSGRDVSVPVRPERQE